MSIGKDVLAFCHYLEAKLSSNQQFSRGALRLHQQGLFTRKVRCNLHKWKYEM